MSQPRRRWSMVAALGCLAALALLAGCVPEEWADVSPNGQHLVVTLVDGSGGNVTAKGGLYLMTPDGGQVRKLGGQGYAPQFSPNSRYLAVERFEAASASLMLHDLTTGRSRDLLTIDPANPPDWIGRGEKIVGLYMLPQWRSDSQALAVVVWTLRQKPGSAVKEPGQEVGRGRGPEVGPGQTGVAGLDPVSDPGPAANDVRGETALIVIEDLEKPQPRKLAVGVGLKCSWSPDGRMVAFFQKETLGAELPDEPNSVLGSLCICEAKTGDFKAVAGGVFNPLDEIAWLSADRLLFMNRRLALPMTVSDKVTPRQAVYSYDLVTKTIGTLIEKENGGGGLLASWFRLSPDRKQLLYCESTMEASRNRLWLLDLATGQRTRMMEFRGQTYPFWLGNDRLGFLGEQSINLALTADLAALAQINPRQRSLTRADFEKLIKEKLRTLDLKVILAPFEPPAVPATGPATTATSATPAIPATNVPGPSGSK